MDERGVANQPTSQLVIGDKRLPLKIVRTVIFSVALILIGVGIGYQYHELSGKIPVLAEGTGKNYPKQLTHDQLDFTLFWQVWEALHSTYLDPEQLDDQALIYGAIQGMTAAVGDPYTVFLPPTENQRTKEDLNGAFDGVGIQLGYKRDTLAVMTPLDDHPAIRQGVKAGDLILNIKDESKGIDEDTAGMSLQEAVSLIRGEKGTAVTLTLYREEKGTFDVTIRRDTIVIPSVEYEIGDFVDEAWQEQADGEVLWIKVRRFGDRTPEQWAEAVNIMIQNREQLSGIILDLRNNPGGFLKGAIDLASDFIPEGLVVEQEGRSENQVFEVTKRGRLLGVPVVVVLNGGSASASEIMAGAMRDRIQAPIVGEQSFGKGTVQEAVDLQNEAGLHITTSRWLLPSGDWIHETGITPDYEVTLPETDSASDSAQIPDTQLQKAVDVLKTIVQE
jgi:carboxyl-terminal processing protease